MPEVYGERGMPPEVGLVIGSHVESKPHCVKHATPRVAALVGFSWRRRKTSVSSITTGALLHTRIRLTCVTQQ